MNYPTVTQILGKYLDSKWFTEESRERGTLVHNSCKNHLLGIYTLPLPYQYQGFFDSFKRYADKYFDKILLVEKRLYDHKHKYSGRPDAIIILKGKDLPDVGDWKTALAFSKTWDGQGAAYHNLAKVDKASGIKELDGAFSLRLKKDGGMPKPEYVHNIDLEFQFFLNALSAHKRYATN
jgi:hypothetical protein